MKMEFQHRVVHEAVPLQSAGDAKVERANGDEIERRASPSTDVAAVDHEAAAAARPYEDGAHWCSLGYGDHLFRRIIVIDQITAIESSASEAENAFHIDVLAPDSVAMHALDRYVISSA